MKKSIHSYHTLFLVSILCLTGCGNGNGEQKSGGAGQKQQTPYFSVTEIPLKTVTAFTTYPSSIEGIVNSEVRAKVSGYITQVLVDEGQKVRRGQTLFKLETQSLNQDAAAAEANVNAAQVEVDKLKPLVEKNIISEVQIETAKAQLQQAKSNYSSIAANIGYANIKSPVDGYVGEIRLRKGSLVSPGNQTPLTTVSDISRVYAYFSMNERDYISFLRNAEGEGISEIIKNLPKVQLVLPDGSEYEEEGTIETINSQVSSTTGAVSFRAVFDNPDRLLTNGNSGKIKVPKIYEDAVVVPKTATFERQGSTYVYKVGQDSMATAAQIDVEKEVDNLYVVSSGLKKDDRIVGKGVAKLSGETKINPQETPFDSIAKPIDQVFR
ncbi:efflux RND transporter periplasmic adaptor subunit [Pricia sp.]|uniref:efflux RND transporter periplasmic adaptor subunit n=1 Tax=Pricia sp. TaxID=2268138 RepID=UPI0035930A6A